MRVTLPDDYYTVDEGGVITLHHNGPKCKHGIERSRCLSIECVVPKDIPIRGENSWDSKLQQPNDGLFLSPPPYFSLRWSIPTLTTTVKAIRWSLSENPKKSRRKPPKATKRAAPVIGYRGWKVVTHRKRVRLRSVNTEYGLWRAGQPTPAKCQMNQKHIAPNFHCSCGLYVLADLKAAPSWYGEFGVPPDVVIGAVMGWGEVIQHGTEGWRAQFAQPIALLNTEVFAEQPLLHEVAESHALPIYSRKGLELYAQEFGERLR